MSSVHAGDILLVADLTRLSRSQELAPEAVDRFCEQIRAWARSESSRVDQRMDPAVAAIDAEIADIEALIEARPARAATMRPLIEELGTKQANLRRVVARKAQSARWQIFQPSNPTARQSPLWQRRWVGQTWRRRGRRCGPSWAPLGEKETHKC